MKPKLYFQAAIYLAASLCMPLTQSMAQAPCPPNGISTNPANPSPANPPTGKEYKKNTFDWKAEFLHAANSNYYITNSPLTNFYNYEVNCNNASLYRANSNLTARKAGAIAPLAIEIRKENIVSEDVSLNVYPSPATSDINILYQLAQPAKVSLFITDALGHNVVTVGSNVPKEKGDQKQSVSVAGLPNGTYFLVVESESCKTSKKFVVVR
jgi:hypothetical protein